MEHSLSNESTIKSIGSNGEYIILHSPSAFLTLWSKSTLKYGTETVLLA